MTRGRACEEGSSEVKWMLPSTTCSRGVGPMTAADGGEVATARWSGDRRRESGRVRAVTWRQGVDRWAWTRFEFPNDFQLQQLQKYKT
jgi:hypothetical protein